MKFHKIIFLFCVFLTLASCSVKIERDPKVLVEALPAEPAILNPILAGDLASYKVLYYVFDSLVEYDPSTLSKKPMLAESWTVSPDGLVYDFQLRKDVTWHDGKVFSADDVVFTFEALLDKRVDAGRMRSYFADLKGVEKTSESSVRFTFAKPYFKALAVIGQIKILPKHLYSNLDNFNSNPLNRKPVGTGPFKFSKWTTGRMIELDRFDSYYGNKPEIKGIKYKIVPNKFMSFLQLKKGSIDLSDLSTLQWEREAIGENFDSKFSKYKYYPPNYSFIAWNMRKEPFVDERVRLALCMLIDKNAINKTVLSGLGVPVTGPLYYLGKNYDKTIGDCGFDPAKAALLLDEARYVDSNGDGVREKDGKKLSFKLLYNSSDSFSRSVGLIIKSQLEKAGVELELNQLEWALLVQKLMQRDFDAASLSFSIPLEEDPFAVWHSSQVDSGSNFFGFGDPVADEILVNARTEQNEQVRSEMFHRFHAIVAEKQPCAFLFMLPNLVAISKRFEDVKTSAVGVDPLQWKIGPSEMLWEW